jgi:hypothetical protein
MMMQTTCLGSTDVHIGGGHWEMEVGETAMRRYGVSKDLGDLEHMRLYAFGEVGQGQSKIVVNKG